MPSRARELRCEAIAVSFSLSSDFACHVVSFSFLSLSAPYSAQRAKLSSRKVGCFSVVEWVIVDAVASRREDAAQPVADETIEVLTDVAKTMLSDATTEIATGLFFCVSKSF